MTLPLLDPIFKKSIVLNNVNLLWSEVYKSYYSVGDFEISNILGTNIGKKMKGIVEITKITNISGPMEAMTLYIEPVIGSWYFFSLSCRTLYCLSSDKKFNDKIGKKDDSNKIPLPEYVFELADQADKTIWLNRFKVKYTKK